jgi:hypothetical protein
MPHSWDEVKLKGYLDQGPLEEFAEKLTDVKEGLTLGLEAYIAALTAAKLYIITEIDPAAALHREIIDTLLGFIQGIKNSGLFITKVIPDLGNLYSTNHVLSLLSTSVLDPLDPYRPIKGQFSEVVLMKVIVARAPTLKDVFGILDLLELFFSVPEFPRALEVLLKGVPDPTPEILGTGAYPDWESGKFSEHFPILGDIADVMEDVVLTLVPVSDAFATLIDEVIEQIELRISILNALIAKFSAAIDSFIGILEAEPFLILTIDGSYTASELSGELLKAQSTIPNAFNDVAGCIALAATVPDAIAILDTIMGN